MEGTNLMQFVQQLTDVKRDYETTCNLVNEANDRNERLIQENQALESEIHHIQETIVRITGSKIVADRKNISLKSSHQIQKSTCSKVLDSLQGLRTKLSNSRGEYSNISDSWVNKAQDFSNDLRKDGHLKKVKSDLFQKTINLRTVLEERDNDLRSWKNEIRNRKERRQKKIDELTGIREHHTRAEKDIEELKKEFADIQSKERSHIIRQKELMDDEEKKFNRIEKNLKEAKIELDTLRQEVGHWSTKFDEKVAEQEGIRKKYDDLNKRLRYLESQSKQNNQNNAMNNNRNRNIGRYNNNNNNNNMSNNRQNFGNQRRNSNQNQFVSASQVRRGGNNNNMGNRNRSSMNSSLAFRSNRKRKRGPVNNNNNNNMLNNRSDYTSSKRRKVE